MFSGKLMVEIEGETPFAIGAGDVLTYPAGLVHRNWVDGEETAYLLAINVPVASNSRPD
jgi:quercetin dioxygenase-like cupin family protein